MTDTDLEAFVRDRLGPDRLTKLKNQTRGGQSNQDGNRYEEFFAVYMIAKLQAEPNWTDISLMSQDAGFVDDLVVYNNPEKSNYQLKNTPSVSWVASNNELTLKFQDQYIIDTEYLSLENPNSILVCSCPNKAQTMQDIPQTISGYTSCIHFPATTSINELLLSDTDFAESIKQICAFPEESDKLEYIAQALLGAWCSGTVVDGQLTDIIRSAKNLLDPDYFIDHSGSTSFSDDLKYILDNIPNMQYVISSGYVTLTSNGFRIHLPDKLNSEKFNQLTQKIISNQPSSFEELSSILFDSGGGIS